MNAMLDSTDRSEAALARQRTEQQALEARLRESEKLAAIGQLAAGVAHELGSPLGVIDGKAQRALRRLPEPTNCTGSWARSAARCPAWAASCASSWISAGATPCTAGRSRSRSWYAPWPGECRHTPGRVIELEGPDGPARGGPLDRPAWSRPRQSAGECAAGGPRTGAVRWALDGDRLRLEVEDDGPGIDAAIRDRLFEPFFTTKPVGEGTGLGLSVAHAAVRTTAATAGGDSPLGGARFTLILPREAGHE
jgi:two-component system, NtrC family, sensor kinase